MWEGATTIKHTEKQNLNLFLSTPKKIQFSVIKNFFGKREQIRRKLQICWYLLTKSLTEYFISSVVLFVHFAIIFRNK